LAAETGNLFSQPYVFDLSRANKQIVQKLIILMANHLDEKKFEFFRILKV
jgi:hypothetical protein